MATVVMMAKVKKDDREEINEGDVMVIAGTNV